MSLANVNVLYADGAAEGGLTPLNFYKLNLNRKFMGSDPCACTSEPMLDLIELARDYWTRVK